MVALDEHLWVKKYRMGIIKKSKTDISFDSSNAFISTNKIKAYSSGELSDLTFAIKDNIDVANEVTGYGSPCWATTKVWDSPQFQGFLVLHKLQFLWQNTMACLSDFHL